MKALLLLLQYMPELIDEAGAPAGPSLLSEVLGTPLGGLASPRTSRFRSCDVQVSLCGLLE